MPFQIRPAREGDEALILGFIKGIAEYEKLSHQVQATEEAITKHLFGPNPSAACLLAFETDTPIGFALYVHNFSTFVCKPGIYLEDLFILPEYRGKGYGKKLLLHLVEFARRNDYGRVEWSVLDWNQPAIDFYKRLGAKPMDEWTVMRISLGEQPILGE